MGTEARVQQNAGLSPRVRGNLVLPLKSISSMGSIPARAGEPTGGTDAVYEVTVYPRACGGTWNIPWSSGIVNGLSPRVRGNQQIGLHLIA